MLKLLVFKVSVSMGISTFTGIRFCWIHFLLVDNYVKPFSKLRYVTGSRNHRNMESFSCAPCPPSWLRMRDLCNGEWMHNLRLSFMHVTHFIFVRKSTNDKIGLNFDQIII